MGEPPKKEYPPGWNDPPMLNYNPSNPPPKSRITNKRVAFPVGSQTHSQSDGNASEPPNMSPLPSKSDTECIESLFLKASENFNKLLENVSEESVKEQIWQMLSAWQARKLSVDIQNMLTEISNGIIEQNSAKVNEIHLKLMMDSSSLVKTYLPAVKYLINNSSK